MGDKFLISADLPGLTKAEVKIELMEPEGGGGGPILKISGDHTIKEDKEEMMV
jgi:HSP20 family molecular chaperone IbpA